MATRICVPTRRSELRMTALTIPHCCRLVAALVLSAGLSPSGAANDCASDMAAADQLISGVRGREESLGRYARDNDMPNACRLLRQNFHDMSLARESMNRCMTGFERGENVAQMDASLEDIHQAITAHCH